jgi:hypothetical protein
MAKKVTRTSTTTSKKTARKAGQRDLIRRGSASAYAKRDSSGQFKELDDVGRSLTADRSRKAKTTVKSGFGDQGDLAPRSRKRTAKKR